MSSKRIRIQIAALIFVLLPAAAGVVAVDASATCERFVRTYVTKPIRNHVSKTTAEAWAEWRLSHPNWKPNPNIHRPTYVMNKQEAVQKVDFACSVPLIDTSADGMLAEVEAPPPIVNFRPMDVTPITFPDVIPPEVAELTPQDEWPMLAPFVPPILGGTTANSAPVFPIVPPETVPPTAGPVPEPASLALVATGMGFMYLLLSVRLRTAKEEASFQD